MVMTSAQMLLSIIFLLVMRGLGLINFPAFEWKKAKPIIPLSFCFFGMVTTGLAALDALNVPMFNAIRRTTSLMTMQFEYWLLGRVVSLPIRCSVWLQVVGALIAGLWDLTFDFWGYFLALLNSALTAGYLVCIAQLGTFADMNSFGQMYYNNILALPWVLLVAAINGEFGSIRKYPHLGDVEFLSFFIASCSQAFVLNYAIFLCTQVNSALTTSVVGQLKNILTTLLGLFAFGDVIYDPLNLMGLAVGTVGSVWYSHAQFRESQFPKEKASETELPPLKIEVEETQGLMNKCGSSDTT
eukprot:GILJ01017639.1.p1 GENE.GILJ01017639.1~~GILJ01017639.1.p1  ORF type:complete len:318 (-),score=28.31 GILJ01017639.1:154-1050(-)